MRRSTPSQYGSRSCRLSSLPLGLRGSAVGEVDGLRAACSRPSRSRANAIRSASLGVAPAAATTTALTASPHVVVRDADDGDVADVLVGHQHVLDLGRVDVLAAGDDHVLHAVVQVDVAVVVEVAGVAGTSASRRAVTVAAVASGLFQ